MFEKIKKYFYQIRLMFFGNSGFTLVELLVVISIIAILATVIGVNYSGARKSARDSKRKADMENVAAAFEMYYSEFKRYPNCGWDIAMSNLNEAGYLNSIPQNTSDENEYQYQCNSDDNWFGVYAKLENKNEKITISECSEVCHPQEGNIKAGSGTYVDGGGNVFYRVVGQ
jgi:general secretion pathway protein G